MTASPPSRRRVRRLGESSAAIKAALKKCPTGYACHFDPSFNFTVLEFREMAHPFRHEPLVTAYEVTGILKTPFS